MARVGKGLKLLRTAFFIYAIGSSPPYGDACSRAFATDGQLNDIIENVRRNEQIYVNLDVRIHESYDIAGRQPEVFDGSSFEIVRKDIGTRFVAQGELFRLEIEGTNFGSAEQLPADRIKAFDGTTTRSYSQKAVGNIANGRKVDTQFIQPHMLPLHFMEVGVPLSTYLRGDEAIRASPQAPWSEDQRLVETYSGEASFDGLRCHRISVQVYHRDRAVARWELWLAEDRNYIPARVLGYDLQRAPGLANRNSSVTEWKEISPGTWFPSDIRVAAYDAASSQPDGSLSLQWQIRYTLEDVSLNPNHDVEFFRNVEFPIGTAVYELENDKVVRKYRVGAPSGGSSRASSERANWWWIIGLNVVGVVLIVLVARRPGRRPP